MRVVAEHQTGGYGKETKEDKAREIVSRAKHATKSLYLFRYAPQHIGTQDSEVVYLVFISVLTGLFLPGCFATDRGSVP